MKIGIFTNNYLPNPYGVGRSIETFRAEFEKKGHSVFIFAPHWEGYQDDDPCVFRYPAVDLKIKIRFPLGVPYSRRMDKIIRDLDLDIIHSQHPNLLGLAAAKWAKRKKIPLIFTWHALYDKYVNFVPFIPANVSTWYIIRKAVNFANRANKVIVPTDSIIPIIKKWGVKNKNIIPIATGVLKEDFSNADGIKIREKYGIKEDETVLLLVARLSQEKNVKFVFQSIKNILKKNKIKLLVVGNGYLRDELREFCQEEKISEKVFLCGEIGHDKIKNYYAAGDIFVYASKSETQGMVITEAMYMGLPIVALNAPGVSSLVLNRANGFLISEDEKEFEKSVEKLINDKELREKFGEVSARLARKNFTSDVCAEKMLEVYKSALKNY